MNGTRIEMKLDTPIEVDGGLQRLIHIKLEELCKQ